MYFTQDKALYNAHIVGFEKILETIQQEEPNTLNSRQEKYLRKTITQAKTCYELIFVSADEFVKGQSALIAAKTKISENISRFQKSNKNNNVLLMFVAGKAIELLNNIRSYC